ncbi:MAG: nitroreductase [Desulfotalea sp.]|nr:MAG: nitroreductase [Desulfotalea sp.]
MIPVNIDNRACSGCGLCVEVCPYRALTVRDGVATYILESCFSCGHCQSVCPEGAIALLGLTSSFGRLAYRKCSEITDSTGTVTGQLLDLMTSRRSCRNYKNMAVPLEILEELVQVGITAPSGTNCQPWGFIILPCREDIYRFGVFVGNYFKKLNRLAESWLLRKVTGLIAGGALSRYYKNHYQSVKQALWEWEVKGEDRLFHGAPSAILVTAKKEASSPVEDAMLATQNILLAAHSIGLGTCLIGFAVEAVRRDKNIRKILEIRGDEELYAVIVVGYPRLSYLRPAGRKTVVPRIFSFDKGQKT